VGRGSSRGDLGGPECGSHSVDGSLVGTPAEQAGAAPAHRPARADL